MKINNNISAVITNKQLLRTEDTLADAMERLSSGIKINHAGDDPSGIAISSKMQTQIDGLDQASQNASDGMSVLESADGALNEVMDILQRMRELAIQAANGTNSINDRQAIQDEIDQLQLEVDRVSETTEFNTKNLLDGSLDKRVYAKGVSRVQVSDEVPEGLYKFTINELPKYGELEFASDLGSMFTAATPLAEDCQITINGSAAHLSAGMTGDDIYSILRSAAEIGEAEITDPGENPFKISATHSGSTEPLEVRFSPASAAAVFGFTNTTADPWVDDPDKGLMYLKNGEDGKVDINFNGDSAFATQPQATISYNGDRFTINDTKGFSIEMMFDREAFDAAGGNAFEVELDITEIGPMNLQIGANEGQQIAVRIPSTSTESLYIDDLNVVTVKGADRAMDALGDAIARLSAVRSDIGAFTNRLEHSVKSLDQTNENMNAAISRLQDTNMASEMSEYTKLNVLQQAATSALTQANELPQRALQLLG